MAIYRYSPESIDHLTRRTRRHHIVGFLIFTGAVCAAGLALFELRAALIYDTIFALVVAVTMVGGRNKARQRTANLLRSTEIEINDEKATWRSKLSKTDFYRSDIVEVCFSRKGIWLRSKARRLLLQFPPELEGFDQLHDVLEEWLPERAVRRKSPPSSVWTNLQTYGIYGGVALLLYAAMASRASAIGIPACLLAGTGIAWYFAWSGRKIDERKWKVLLPLIGYLAAAALLGRAFTLWVNR
jgi:hypothetical protein